MKRFLLILALAGAAQAQALGSFHKLSAIPRSKTVFETPATSIELACDKPFIKAGGTGTVTVKVEPQTAAPRTIELSWAVRGVKVDGPDEVVIEGGQTTATFRFKLGRAVTAANPAVQVQAKAAGKLRKQLLMKVRR